MRLYFLLFISFLVLSNEAHAGMFVWTTWNTRKGHGVKVCFANPVEDSKESYKRSPWSDEQKHLVQSWVEQEYTPERTGIYFYGFTDCVVGDRSNVIINYRKRWKLGWDSVTRAQSTLGQGLMYASRDFPGAAGSIQFFISGLSKSTVIHEFGHTAGLMHEHDHPNAVGCDIDGGKKEPMIFARGYTEYDPDSIMSYCVTRNHRDRGLSQGDLFTLRLMYIEHVSPPEKPDILR